MSAERKADRAGGAGPRQIGTLPGSAFRETRRAVANDNRPPDRSIQAELLYLGGLSLIMTMWLFLIMLD
jgi:hypothetical protein